MYSIHQRVLAITHGDKAIRYGPVGALPDGRMVVLLRAADGTALPGVAEAELKTLEDGMRFTVRTGVRLIKQTCHGECMPDVDEAMEKWNQALSAGGFGAENTHMRESAISFFHRRLKRRTTLPFWAVTCTLIVVDAKMAAETMVRGVGRNRGLGFGMLAA